MTSNKQKKIDNQEKTIIIEGIAKKTNKNFQKIVEEFEDNFKQNQKQKKKDYDELCHAIEDLATSANDCYGLFIGDGKGLNVNSRNPFLLLKYTQLFINALLEIKKMEKKQKQQKKDENAYAMAAYNQNNIYELMAKKNIQFLEMEGEIKQLRQELSLATKRAVTAEELTTSVKQMSDQMLKVYRENYMKMSEFLRRAEQKQTELLQSNRLLNEQIQTINLQFEIYKKNFKKKGDPAYKQKRQRQVLQKQYQDKLAQVTKQLEHQYKNNNKPR